VAGIDDEWVTVKKVARSVASQGSHHSLRHTIVNLSPATDYEAAVQVKNKNQWGTLGKFSFSTRKGKGSRSVLYLNLEQFYDFNDLNFHQVHSPTFSLPP